MLHATGWLPARYLSLIAHLLITLTLYLSRDENVKACLPLDYLDEDYRRQDLRLAVGLWLGTGLLLVEFVGFFAGISTFAPSVCLVSIGAHATASVAMAFMALDVWDCNLYWWILALGYVVPALAEIGLMIGALRLKKLA